MEMLEGNVFVVSNKQCTVEFQPSADMSWQSWANNELNQAATYPSPYANVSKGNMCTMGATIGMGEEDLFKPYTLEVRNSHVKRVNEFMISLPSSLSERNRHSRKTTVHGRGWDSPVRHPPNWNFCRAAAPGAYPL